MLFKGNTIVTPYQVNGTIPIRNINGVDLYNMPWYEERIVYKGNELVWPGFTTEGLLVANKPNKSSECFCAWDRVQKPDYIIPTSFTGQKFGYFRQSSGTFGSKSYSFSEHGTVSNGVRIGCMVSGLSSFKNPYPSNVILLNSNTSYVMINKDLAMQNNLNYAIVEFGATLLCFTSITKTELEIRDCNVNSTADIPAPDYGAWNSGSGVASTETPIFTSGTDPIMKMYKIRCRGNSIQLWGLTNDYYVCAPRFTFYSSNTTYHCQCNTLWCAIYLY